MDEIYYYSDSHELSEKLIQQYKATEELIEEIIKKGKIFLELKGPVWTRLLKDLILSI